MRHGAGETLPGRRDHGSRLVDCDHPSPREAFQERLRDSPRPAARVQDYLVALQRQSLEHFAAERLHGGRDPVVAAPLPLANRDTIVRYHVSERPVSPARILDSWPPCQAIGDRAGGSAASTTSSAFGIARA